MTLKISELRLWILQFRNTGYKFSDTKSIIAGMNIPIYTISYNYAADSLSELASINEAASIVGNSEDITYKLRNLFNAEM